jgi:hypothetical protein
VSSSGRSVKCRHPRSPTASNGPSPRDGSAALPAAGRHGRRGDSRPHRGSAVRGLRLEPGRPHTA